MSTPITPKPNAKQRKAKHLSICINQHEYEVEHGNPGFDAIRFVHNPLPELDADRVITETDFLGTRISAPIFISCMTGGSDEGFRANRNLAQAAQLTGVPVGMGSFRVLFEHEEVFEHFRLKKIAPDVPVLANIGGVQIREFNHSEIEEYCKRLEVDALVIHLNPGQELFQPDGDRNFSGIRDSIAAYCERSSLPVIVKETGFGIPPDTVADLLSIGVSYVDIAGAGGTNWISVESYRGDTDLKRDANEFENWGIPTAILLAAIRERFHGKYDNRILASGGLRTGQDMAKAIALGAELAGTALPLIREEAAGGVDAVVAAIERVQRTLRNIMVLTASPTVEDLRHAPIWTTEAFASEAGGLARVDRASGRKRRGTSDTIRVV